MDKLYSQDWEPWIAAAKDPNVKYPEYYIKPFHGYLEGNLTIQAALEFDIVTVAVHSIVMDPESKVARLDGDATMRNNFAKIISKTMQSRGQDQPKSIVDIGCATGLSSRQIMGEFPVADVTGVDLGEYFLAVGEYQKKEREAESGKKEPLTFIHAQAENLPMESNSVDLVTIALLFHELPTQATQDILKECFRVLRPGGALAVMEVNPQNKSWGKLLGNPFAYAAFRSTEPWLENYLRLDMEGSFANVGFSEVLVDTPTPKHKAVIGFKPE